MVLSSAYSHEIAPLLAEPCLTHHATAACQGIANNARSGRGVAAGADCAGGGLDVYPVDAGSRVVEHRGALDGRVALG